MPRRKRQDPPEGERDDIEEPREEDAPGDDFLSVLDGVAGDDSARVDIYRRGPQGREFCGKVLPDDFTLDRVKELFGGGRFELRLMVGRRYVKGETVTILGPVVDLARRLAPETRTDREDRRDAEEDARRDRLSGLSTADAIAELRRDMRDFLRDVRNPPPAAYGADPVSKAMELAKNMQALFRPYMDALQKREGAPDVVEYIRLGMDLAEAREPRERDPLASMVKDAAMPLIKALTAGNVNPQHLEQPAPMPPQEPRTVEDLLTPWLPTLLTWARRGADPRLRAYFIADELPEHFASMLDTFTSDPQGLTRFLTRFPEAMETRVWFEELFHALRIVFGHEEEPEEKAPTAELGGPTDS